MSFAKNSVELAEIRMVIENVSWSTFVSLADQRRGSMPRLTYDDGLLEMMNPKRQHENIGRLIGRMIESFSELKQIEIISVASVTVKRADLNKAYEADESYYVAHAPELLGKEELDFEVDPAPDLVVEVELTCSAISKRELFAKMQVPEFWIHDGMRLKMYRLMNDQYSLIQSSIELPGLTTNLIDEFLALRNSVGETKLIRAFRERVGS